MAISPLPPQDIESLVGSRHATTGIEYPQPGLQPYYDWLVQSLHLLAEASAGALRVARADDNPTSVHVMQGRASIDDVPLAFAGEQLDLAAYNNDTALLWLYDNAGEAGVGHATTATGWPTDSHIKLAQVTLEAGQITAIVDRRFETIFRV